MISTITVKIASEDRFVKDFFISYTGSDENQATWVAELLESNGKSVTIQAWDFKGGENFIKNINTGLTECKQLLIILSDQYLSSYWCQEEWTSKLKEQVELQERKIIPIRISPVRPVGLLGPLVYIDIVDKTQEEATKLILEGIKDSKERTSNGFIPYYSVEHYQIDLDYIVTSDKIIYIKRCKTKILESGKNCIHNRITWFADEKIKIKSLSSNCCIENISMQDTSYNFNVVFNRELKKDEIVEYAFMAVLPNKHQHFDNFFSTEVIVPIRKLNMHLNIADKNVKYYYTQKVYDSLMNVRTEPRVKHEYIRPSHWYIDNPELHFEYKISWQRQAETTAEPK